ncbi:phosphatidylglycerophosphatase and protein-tyrosine phosphatase 1 [Erpetoichthys calabaricus]|uniref:Phosphatidylglycerophosphatase and protein-tyrosine phosphatase 1 n=1 Tax=Erpetoichthys calabaricus TaxID=27687 RepID=A0A8C4XI73_ERPCA|nr:phosphatidylglycerophosphatase and protein-tyrosine phosphatase 1 [Erpetoichthys calabaricus]
MMAGLAARLLFYPSLAYNILMEKVTGRRWYDRIDETVILGALPFKSITKELVHNHNVRGVITLNEAWEIKSLCNSEQEWREAGVEWLHLATVDFTGVPSLEQLHRGVSFALRHRTSGSSIYVHCKAGRSRSATLVAAYLIKVHCWTPEEARHFIASVRPHILIRRGQMAVLHQYHREACLEDSS